MVSTTETVAEMPGHVPRAIVAERKMQNTKETVAKTKMGSEYKIGASGWLKESPDIRIGADIFAVWGGWLNQTREKEVSLWQLKLAARMLKLDYFINSLVILRLVLRVWILFGGGWKSQNWDI